jgi:hypothetical protein
MPALQDLLNLAAEARLQQWYADTRADALKAAAVGEAERVRAEGVPLDRLASDRGLGSLRLDGAGAPPRPVISKREEVASWLAERSPGLVTATITVPADKLEDALKVLSYAELDGPTVTAKVVPADEDLAVRWIAQNCIAQADPDTPGAWNVLFRDSEGHLSPVPGVNVVQPRPRWVMAVDDERKKDMVATAVAEVDTTIAELRAPKRADALPIPSPAPAGADAVERFDKLVEREPGAEVSGLSRAQLVQRCRDAGLATSGTKAALVERLTAVVPA